MPGINLTANLLQNEPIQIEKINLIQKGMLHSKRYFVQKIIAEDSINISATVYKSYPIEIFETKKYLIVIEGYIYNKDFQNVKNSVLKIADMISTAQKHKEKLRKFINESDGEFIIIIFDKSNNKLFVINDYLGKLPFYYYANSNNFIASREIKFITPFLNSLDFNKESFMEYLLYGFPFGKNTFIMGIYRMRPASLLSYNLNNSQFSDENNITINFDELSKKENDNSPKELKKIFLEVLGNRVKKLSKAKEILSLSGGLDSRAVLAGLNYFIQPKAMSEDRNSGEESYAKSLADNFNIDLKLVKPDSEKFLKNCEEIVFMKDGLLSTIQNDMLSILPKIVDIYGEKIAMYTGMFGGEIFRYQPIYSKKTKQLLKFLLNTNEGIKYSTKKVSRILNIEKKEIYEHLRSFLRSFNEKEVENKYIHFRFEFNFRNEIEGEDKYRFFFWETSPFYSNSIFKYAYSLDKNLKDTLFFRNFLYELNPKTCNVRDWNYKISLNNLKKISQFRFFEHSIRYPKIRYLIKSLVLFKSRLSNLSKRKLEINKYKFIRKMILNKLNNSKLVIPYISVNETKKIVQKESNIIALYRLLDVILYIEIAFKWYRRFNK